MAAELGPKPFKITSITQIFDPVLDFFAKLGGFTGAEAESYKATVGANFLAWLGDLATDWLAKGAINRAIKALGAFAAGITCLLAKDIPSRLKHELATISSYLATRAIHFSPRGRRLAAEEVEQLRKIGEALARGDFESAAKLAFTQPEELSAFFEEMLGAFAQEKEFKKTLSPEEEEIIEEEELGEEELKKEEKELEEEYVHLA